MIRILDRLVLRTFFKTFFLCLAAAPILFIIGDITENLDQYIDRGLTGMEVARAYVFQMPLFIRWSFPIATLLATAPPPLAAQGRPTTPVGPDAFGYVVYDHSDPECAFQFVDISTGGTIVSFTASGGFVDGQPPPTVTYQGDGAEIEVEVEAGVGREAPADLDCVADVGGEVGLVRGEAGETRVACRPGERLGGIR